MGLQTVSLDAHVHLADRDIVGIEADIATELAEQTDYPGESKMVNREQNVGMRGIDCVVRSSLAVAPARSAVAIETDARVRRMVRSL